MSADKNKKKRGGSSGSGEDEPSEPIVRDKRRIDPETGEPRVMPSTVDATEEKSEENADHDSSSEDESESDDSLSHDETYSLDETISDDDIAKLLESAKAPTDAASEHLEDLKRVQAEYANYRKRVDRDRFVARELAVAEVMTGILPVLDDLDLAQAHGDLEGSPLELVAQKIRTSFERYGLVQVGAVGELFDPKLHEAIAQLPSKDATEEVIADVVSPGYLLGERLLRAAKVAVTVPED